MGKIFGIDLGTTYSCIAYVDEYGKPAIIANKENEPVTPSVVYFESPDNVIVGRAAKQNLENEPLLVCSTIKRQMGNSEYRFIAHGKEYKPETISAFILKKLAEDASMKLNEEVKDVVITCPAYFGSDERTATRKAGELAGLNVLSIINEPTAAAISYGIKVDEPQTVIVYDLGGGTFDVTVIKVYEGHIDVIATGGDHMLGGKDWDAEIQKLVIDQYVKEYGGSEDDVRDDEEAMAQLELKSEEAKIRLSESKNESGSTFIRLNGKKIDISLEQFNSKTATLLENTISMMRDTMTQAAKKGVTDYDKILLVGGSTFMPQVRTILEKEFPNIPIDFCDPNESVARGAALYGANLMAYQDIIRILIEKDIIESDDDVDRESVQKLLDDGVYSLPPGEDVSMPIKIRNVISKSIACTFRNKVSGEIEIVNVIFKNTAIPWTKEIGCETSEDNQSRIELNIYENNYSQGHTPRDVVAEEDATILTTGYLEPLPPGLPKGSPIELKLIINEEGLLSADVTDMSRPDGVTVHITVDLKNAMTQEEFEEAKKQLSSITLA